MAESDRAVRRVDETQMRMIALVWNTPACAVIYGRRRNRMTPSMFWTQGRKTPLRVPRSWG